MGKQYTFKTTKDTLWLEKILDNMDKRCRSEFIRNAIVSTLTVTQPRQDDRKVFSSDKMTDKTSVEDLRIQRTDNSKGFEGSDKMTDTLTDFDIIEEDIDDLDSKLDSIKF